MLVLAASLGPAEAGRCAEPPRIASGVAALHGGVTEAESFTLAEIREMARRSGKALVHPPLGFYITNFGHAYDTRTVTETSLDGARCGTLTTVTVRLMLTDRAVVVASDLREHGCDREAVARHYRKHAAADDKAVSEGVQVLNKDLIAAWPAIQGRLPPSGASDGADLRAAIEPVVAQSMAGVERMRTEATAKVDTADEVLALASLCTTRS